MRFRHATLLPLAVAIATLAGCGDRISNDQLSDMSSSLADVLLQVQRGTDSTSRARLADSVARARGYDGWRGLRDEIGDVAIEPEKLRTMLDSTQKQIERRTQ